MSSRSVKNDIFKFGLVNKIEAKDIPRGAASESSNFLTKLDSVELTRGRLLLGTSISGAGKIKALRVGYDANGVQILHRVTSTGLLQYYSSSTLDWVNITTGLTNEDHQFSPYRSLAGAQLFMSSDTDGYYKIMVDNHAVVNVNYSTNQPVKGKIRIKRGRSFMWSLQDPTTLYGSYIDSQNVGTQYTQVTAEAVGSSGSITYTGTLAFKGSGARRTCFGVSFTDAGTGEILNDNFDGTLIGTAGGTGTINYATGAYSITFNVITTGSVTSTYKWEDSAVKGVVDFSHSGTRAASEGFKLPQAEGGDFIQSVDVYSNEIYSLKRRKIYKLTLNDDDLTINSKVFSERCGITYWKGTWEDDEGIFLIDDSTENEPKFRVIKTMDSNGTVMPQLVTDSVDLSGYTFDECDMIGWGDYVCFLGRTNSASQNDTLFMFHKIYRTMDKIAWSLSRLEVIDGSLVGGESISNNVYLLFSGLDDDNFGIEGSWEGRDDDLSIQGLKKVKRLRVWGNIGQNQKIYVENNFDNSGWTPAIDTAHPLGAIDGQGDYVDTTQSVSVGATTVGRFAVGGGSDGITAYAYYTEFHINTGKFERVKTRFKVISENEDGSDNIGYASVSGFEFFDIASTGNRLPSKYL